MRLAFSFTCFRVLMRETPSANQAAGYINVLIPWSLVRRMFLLRHLCAEGLGHGLFRAGKQLSV